MKYSPKWELPTIPDAEFKSEHGRRNRAKSAGNVKLEPCRHCGIQLTARQRRAACPGCGGRQ